MADSDSRRCKRSRAWHRARWRDHVDAHACSGGPVPGYCREHGLRTNSFYRWRRIFREEAGKEPVVASGGERVDGASPTPASGAGRPEEPRFVELKLSEGDRFLETSGVEVLLPAGRRLRVSPGFDEDTLRRAVSALESLPC